MRYLAPCCTLLAALGTLGAVSLADQPRQVTIGAPQIFVDLEAAVESMENVEQIFHSAQKHPKNPVLRWEKPWETKTGTPCAPVIYDEQEKLFKCWYFGIPTTIEGQPIWGPTLQCYATSQDGIHWERPNLGLHEFEGSKQNNIIIPLSYHKGMDHWETVLKDPLDPDSNRRYKGFGWSSFIPGLWSKTSPDGLHWTHSSEPVFTGLGDAQSLMIDTLENRYVVFLRALPHRKFSVSKDFVNWSEPELSIQAGPGEQVNTIYQHMGFVYGDTYLGMLTYFHRGDPASPYYKTLDVRLLTSRDGLRYKIAGPDPVGREPLIGCGGIGQWDRFLVMITATPPIRVGDKLYIYHRGGTSWHKPFSHKDPDEYNFGANGLATLRVDGFASLAATFAGGQFTTRPVVCTGTGLTVNAIANPGKVWVELLDESGEPIPGYTKEDCVPAIGNGIELPVSWQGKSGLGELAGRAVQLRFHLSNAQLFAYRMVSGG